MKTQIGNFVTAYIGRRHLQTPTHRFNKTKKKLPSICIVRTTRDMNRAEVIHETHAYRNINEETRTKKKNDKKHAIK